MGDIRYGWFSKHSNELRNVDSVNYQLDKEYTPNSRIGDITVYNNNKTIAGILLYFGADVKETSGTAPLTGDNKKVIESVIDDLKVIGSDNEVIVDLDGSDLEDVGSLVGSQSVDTFSDVAAGGTDNLADYILIPLQERGQVKIQIETGADIKTHYTEDTLTVSNAVLKVIALYSDDYVQRIGYKTYDKAAVQGNNNLDTGGVKGDIFGLLVHATGYEDSILIRNGRENIIYGNGRTLTFLKDSEVNSYRIFHSPIPVGSYSGMIEYTNSGTLSYVLVFHPGSQPAEKPSTPTNIPTIPSIPTTPMKPIGRTTVGNFSTYFRRRR